MAYAVNALPTKNISLLPSIFTQRATLNRRYMMSLSSENLLQNYLLEAGLWSSRGVEGIHLGWESPTCQLRGHFLGHWLSAAAMITAAAGDAEVKAKADKIVSELAKCQEANGGEWAGPIPEKYLDWISQGRQIWAPHYTVHKTLMGLYDMYSLAGNEQALEILIKWAKWFHRWTGKFSRDEMDDILDVETGGMLEVWANLYGVTGQQEHLDLIHRYDRRRLFDRLLAGEDALTNMHANTTIPEIHGAARAYEVTGEKRWRDIVEAYWKCAVTDRAAYCTGGQTCGEVWTPPQELSPRLGDKNQEFCTVYNMMRLAEMLFRWTGDLSYGDYWERNLINGVLAQQNAETGLIAYFLPLEAGAKKKWGSATEDFWCCHGTLVQAHATHRSGIYFEDEAGLIIQQYIPSQLSWSFAGHEITVEQKTDDQTESVRRPESVKIVFSISCGQPTTFTLRLRVPWWVQGQPIVTVNGVQQKLTGSDHAITLTREWQSDQVTIQFAKALTTAPLPDQPDQAAFMDGPVVLAGLIEEQRTLYGDQDDPKSILVPENEREWSFWRTGYRTKNQERNFRFIPLYEVQDERYTVYFPIKDRK